MTHRIRTVLSTRPMRLVGWIGIVAAVAGLFLIWVIDIQLVGAVNRAVEPVAEAALEMEARLAERIDQLTDLSMSARSESLTDDTAAAQIAARTDQVADQLDRTGEALQSLTTAVDVVDRILPDRFDSALAELVGSATDAQGIAADLRSGSIATAGAARTEAFASIANAADSGAEALGVADDAVDSVRDAVERARSSAVRIIHLIALLLSAGLLWFGLGQTALVLGGSPRR